MRTVLCSYLELLVEIILLTIMADINFCYKPLGKGVKIPGKLY